MQQAPTLLSGGARRRSVSKRRDADVLAISEVRRLDHALARAAREGSALRLQLGAALEAVARRGGHHEMGFSSLEAYALEWCERSSRWVQEARHLARALEGLPEMRAALVAAEMSWSMASLVAGKASPADEAAWLEATRLLTVRQMRALTCPRPLPNGGVCDGIPMNDVRAQPPGVVEEPPNERREDLLRAVGPSRVLALSVEREDAWLFECARTGARRISGAVTAGDVLEALLAEGAVSLADAGVPDALETAADASGVACPSWEDQLESWRDQAEASCEDRLAGPPGEPSLASERGEVRGLEVPSCRELERWTLRDLHELVCGTGRRLAVRDLAVGRLAEWLWSVDGWRRLGYATERQYVRERLGLRTTCIKSKRALARRVAALPEIAEALAAGSIGSEAARLVASVADAASCPAWIARAEQRTVVHLREEVAAAVLVARLDGTPRFEPPCGDTLRRVAAAESAVISGAWLLGRCATPRHAECATSSGSSGAGSLVGIAARAREKEVGAALFPAQLHDTVDEAREGRNAADVVGATCQGEPAPQGRMSAASGADTSSAEVGGSASLGADWVSELLRLAPRRPGTRAVGRVVLRLRVSATTHAAYRGLERALLRYGGVGVPLLRYLCLSFLDTWKHALPVDMAYGQIYARDRFRCSSPVCSRRDVTPHHLLFRSMGGSDDDQNLASLCVWCHLEGVHGGRLRASPPASRVHWEIGRDGALVVKGRERTRRRRAT